MNLVANPAAVAMAYELAVKQGIHEANQFKIVMLGAEGAGKTSTVHSLLDEKFQPHQPSTVGADTHTADICNTFTADRVFVCNWRPREFQRHLDEISVHYKHELKQEMSKTLRTKHKDILVTFKKYSEVSESAGLEVLQNKDTPGDKVRLVIYDLGGQEIYYEVHYLFLASHDIVFLTFNASVSLDEPVVKRQRYSILQEKYKTRETLTNFEVIEATLHTICSHCGVEGNEKSISHRNPTVIMIATHSVNLSESEKKAIADRLFYRLPRKLCDHFPRKKRDIIHFIDNKTRDAEAFNHLKAVAVKAAEYTLTEERPISYLKFEEKVIAVSQKETEISKERAFSIAVEVGLKPTNDNLLALLQYYTFKGILLHYPDDETLKNTIFISPQWVSDLVTCVIKTHDYAELNPPAELYNKCIRFDRYGLLEEELLDDMLKRSGYSKDIVLGLLEKFELAIEIDRSTKFEYEDEFYPTPDSGRVFFVPSMLVHNNTVKIQDHKKPKGYIDNVILYHFPDKFIPDTVFNHVVILVTKWCNIQGHRIRWYVRNSYCVFYVMNVLLFYSIFHGIGVFDFSDGKQSFVLEHCSDTFSIKCRIYVHKQELQNNDLWKQRWYFLDLILCFIKSVHSRCIPKAVKPIAYVECPLHYDKKCIPHLRLDAIKLKTLCTKVNQFVSKDAYRLLLEPMNQCGQLTYIVAACYNYIYIYIYIYMQCTLYTLFMIFPLHFVCM